MVFIVASSVSDEYHYAVMNIVNLIIVLELGPFSFCGVTMPAKKKRLQKDVDDGAKFSKNPKEESSDESHAAEMNGKSYFIIERW